METTPWSDTMLIFAYGSDLHEGDLAEFCRQAGRPPVPLAARRPLAASLAGYRLAFTHFSAAHGGGIANLVADPQAAVEGVVFDLDPDELEILDRRQGYPFLYARLRVQVRPVSRIQTLEAAAYVIPAAGAPGHVPPDGGYLSLLVEGARQHGLSPAWLAHLEGFRPHPGHPAHD